MKIFRILIIVLFAGLLCSCNNEEADLEVEKGIIKLNLNTQIDVSVKSIVEYDEVNDIYGVQIYEKDLYAEDEEYKPYCLGLFDGTHINNIKFSTNPAKVYKVCCAALIGEIKTWQGTGTNCSPFSFGGDISLLKEDNINAFVYNASNDLYTNYKFDKLNVAGIQYGGESDYYYCRTKRYYGEASNIAANVGNLDIVCKANFFVFNIKAKGMPDGKYMRFSVMNVEDIEAGVPAKHSEIRYYPSANMNAGLIDYFNLISFDFSDDSGEDISLFIQLVDAVGDSEFILSKGKVVNLKVKRKTAYNIVLDYSVGFSVSINDITETIDGGDYVI